MIEYDEKNQKYTIRKTLCSDRKHNSVFIEAFVGALESNGFSGFQVLIPLNSNSKDKCISFEKFLELGRIYGSQIIIGENLDNGDSVKALLVDYESKCSFADEDFTNGYGSPEVLVESSDPIRAHYLISQLQLFTEKEGKRRFFSHRGLPFLLLSSIFYFLFVSIRKQEILFLSIVQNKSLNTMLNLLLLVLWFLFTLGLLVDSRKKLWIVKDMKPFKRWFLRFYRGEFNNYIVSQIALLVIGAILGAVIIRFFN